MVKKNSPVVSAPMTRIMDAERAAVRVMERVRKASTRTRRRGGGKSGK